MKTKAKTNRRRGGRRLMFDVRDILAAQKGDAKAWQRIKEYFKPRIRVMVYEFHQGYTPKDYEERQAIAEATLLESLMKFRVYR